MRSNELVDDDVLYRQPGLSPKATDKVSPKPPRALAREGRHDDLVGAIVLDRLDGSDERIRVRDLPVDVESFGAQDRERRPKPTLGFGVLATCRVALRTDDEEARRTFVGSLTDPVEELLVEHRLVRDDEDVGSGTHPDVGDDMLDGSTAGGFAYLLDEVLA